MRRTVGPRTLTVLLTICFTLSYTDRHVLSLLVDPVKASLGLSDTQVGLVQGLSFSIFYVLASLPLARLADRGDRPRIMSGCIAVWCAMTMLCGLVTNFWQLLSARIGVAASEAGLPPAALTMMADVNKPKNLARSASVFMIAPFLGGGIALIGGGALYGFVQHSSFGAWWGLAGSQPWRLVFLMVGAPGLIAAISMLLVKDARTPTPAANANRGFGDLFGFLRTHARFSASYILTMAMMVILLNANVSWMPAVLMRAHHVDARTVGLLFGPVFLIFGVVGTLGAGMIISRNDEAMVLRIFRFMRGCIWIALPAAAIGPLTPSLELKLPLIGLTLLCVSAVNALSSMPFLLVAPQPVRAQAVAFLALITALVGTGLGPMLVGILSDRLTLASQPLALALSTVCAVAGCIAVLLLNFLVRRAGSGSIADAR
jgi:MFS family permease